VIAALLLSLVSQAAPTLASPEFSTLHVGADVAQFCNEHLAQQLASRGVQVTTARQVTAALGLERQRQLLGCEGSGESCLAELAAALGVDGMLLGDLAKLGSKYQVNLRVVKSNSTAVIATWSRSVSREDDLISALTDAAEELAPSIFSGLGKTPAGRHWPLAPTLVAGGLAVASAVSFGIGVATHERLVNTTLMPGTIDGSELTRLVTQGQVTQGVALGTLIGAGVSLGLSVVLYFLSGRDEPVKTALAPWLGQLGSARW
jgi:hypothetical protein